MLKIYFQQLEDAETFDSIITSQRKFNNLILDTCKLTTLENFWRLKAIAYKYSLSITTVTWESNKNTKTETIALLNLFPNIKSLIAIRWKLYEELYEEPTIMLSAQSLESLQIVKCDKATSSFFSRYLPKNIIKDCKLHGEPENFLANQSSIQKLDLSTDFFNPEELINMKLSHLRLKLRKYRMMDQPIIKTILERQKKLKSLDLLNCEGCFANENSSFFALCNLNLDSLKINIDDLHFSVFRENFGRLKKLTSLEIESVEHINAPIITILDDFSQINLPHLKILKIYLSNLGIPNDTLERFGKNFTSLQNFTIRCDNPLSLDCYLYNLKKIDSLNIDYHYSREFSKLCINFDFKFDHLRNLSLNGFSFGSGDTYLNEEVLLKMATIMPNVEKLELDAAFPFQTEFIFKLLGKWNNLKVLKNLILIQSGDTYKKFDQQSVLDFCGIAGMLDAFVIELKLKTIDMDVIQVRENLSQTFNVTISRTINAFIIRIDKKKTDLSLL